MDISPLARWATGCFVNVIFMFRTCVRMKHHPGGVVKTFKIVRFIKIPMIPDVTCRKHNGC